MIPGLRCATIGNFRNNGREWRAKGTPEEVNVHDLIDPDLPRAVPYGVYDLTTTWMGEPRH